MTLQTKIVFILEGVLGIPHEDKTNRIEMLRKVENELRGMAEKREYIASRPKPTRADPSGVDLEKLENEVDKTRKDKRMKRNREIEDAEMRERERRNEEKKEKQRNLVIFKGHPQMQRAKKKELKPKQKKDDKPSEEVMDQLRYLGERMDQQAPMISSSALEVHK